jgi:UDP-glucose 4-epimerase
VATCYASAERAHELLEWSAKRSLDEMCVSMWRYYQAGN